MDRGRQKEDANLSRIPVFVFPSTMYFNAHDRDHLKQILTIYNPYEFPIRFRVLSNASTFYNVRVDEGTISSKNSLDLIIKVSTDVRLEATTPLKHKFRIQIFHQHTKQEVGRRDVESIIHFGNLPSHLGPTRDSDTSSIQGASSSEPFQQFPSGSMGSSKETAVAGSSGATSPMAIFPQTHSQPNYVVLIVALVCIVGLLLPYSTESCKANDSNKSHLESILPTYLHLSVNQKLLFAYTLGLVTMVILRP
ncbi:Motile sperm domain-containing protein 1 [Orchesella cincta]|uniref:Motile sperm domain-containing protein 1 n=1 Tax=Orchesella cincta TaxID=48709 RepID=A0A1D2NJH6_ORCCI|nr:Motile sperm domain-containing protein 1 [Orchesella cincta]